jgi:3-oxoacyl-[acyl-carrier protein] reductase
MDLGIKNRVAIVGGASKGLGRASAERLAAEGANLTICARNEQVLEETADAIRHDYGVDVLAISADWSQSADIDRTVEETIKTYNRLDILVHNTGGPPPGEFADHPDDHWQDAFELLLFSAIRMYRAVTPHMEKNQWGRIINIASITVKEPWESLILSNVFRSGLVSLAKTISRKLAADNILINTVCPGLYLTQRMENVLENQALKSGRPLEDVVADYTSEIPVGRMGDPDELANLVAFFASNLASNITGTTVQADGGAIKSIL